MPLSKIIKICKVESKAFAKYCIFREADFLGVHVIDFELNDDKQALCYYIQMLNGKVILLTKERSLHKLRKLIAFYRPSAIQLHYPLSSKEFESLSDQLDIDIVPVFTNETDCNTVASLLKLCRLAIYDTSYTGGTGVAHDRKHLSSLAPNLATKVLLAGGVNPASIDLSDDSIGGYDIQSYCRSATSHHYGKSEQVLSLIKGRPRRQISISLTDVLNHNAIPSYIDTGSLEYQIDYSTGELYENFAVDTDRIKRIIKDIDAPFTLHVFANSAKSFQKIIDEFMEIACDKIVRVNIQYSPGLDLFAINTYNAKMCASIYYKDIQAYTSLIESKATCYSLILATDLSHKRHILSSNNELLSRIKNTEVWFDRKVDLDTIELVLKFDKNANFIVGEYVLRDWSNEVHLHKALEEPNL